MRKADDYLKESIVNILETGHYDENPRPHWLDEYEGKYDALKKVVVLENGDTVDVSNARKVMVEDNKVKVEIPAYTKSVNAVVHKYDISKGEFPITTLRQIYIKKAIGEMLWIYQDASNDLDLLKEKYKVGWWDEWDLGDRTIGACYGGTIKAHDMTRKLLDDIIKDPYGRRHIINMWQVEDFEKPHGLKPCCFQTQYLVRGEYIDMILYQRSSDYMVSGNINEMQYVALMMMVARHCGYKPGVFTHIMANQQIYDRHFDQAKELLERKPTLEKETDIKLVLNPEKKDFYDITVDDFTLEGYTYNKPQLTFEVAI